VAETFAGTGTETGSNTAVSPDTRPGQHAACDAEIARLQARAEAAETMLARVRNHCVSLTDRYMGGDPGGMGARFPGDVQVSATWILAVLGGEGAAAGSVADTERIEAAAAVLERRYPGTRPEQLDTVISELHSLARARRRMTGSSDEPEARHGR
jgi:hypothetical protein